MILALSGKKQVGKDLVGQIIQYLTSEKNSFLIKKPSKFRKDLTIYHSDSYIESCGNLEGIVPKFKNKKFADKLKDIVCLLIGCTREQLEDEEFKNTELGKEWLVCKDIDKNILYNWTSIWGYQYRNGNIFKNIFTNAENENFNGVLIKPTPRFLLQNIGTDLFRNQLHPNIWVNSLMSEYQIIRSGMGNRQPDDLDDMPMEYPNWIITDMRFPNELEAVKERNGLTIRVNRPHPTLGIVDEHPSETALDNAEFDYVIENDGTLEELIEKVKEILIKEKII